LAVLKAEGGSERVELGEGEPQQGFVDELSAAVGAIERGREADLLGGQLARDALVLCNKECESVLSGKPVQIA
jgi:hypothetical protein